MTDAIQSKDFLATAETIEIQSEDDFFGMDWYDPTCYASEILNAKYQKVLVDDVIDKLDHLNTQQKLGWEIHSEFCRIPQLFKFWTFWTPEFSSEFYFSDPKMCSRQF